MRLIDADRTKESIPETSVDIFENCARCGLLDREQVFDLIDEQPTIDSVKHGKWEDVEEVLYEGNTEGTPYTVTAVGYKCSECGTEMGYLWSFCPNCGAKMERSEE